MFWFRRGCFVYFNWSVRAFVLGRVCRDMSLLSRNAGAGDKLSAEINLQ